MFNDLSGLIDVHWAGNERKQEWVKLPWVLVSKINWYKQSIVQSIKHGCILTKNRDVFDSKADRRLIVILQN